MKNTINKTIEKFGYPETLIKEYDYWVILLRPKQVTIWAMILAYKWEETKLSELNKEAFVELEKINKDINKILEFNFQYDKINHLMLMMKDKHIHYHIIPRYERKIIFEWVECIDKWWPKFPEMWNKIDFNNKQFNKLKQALTNNI